MKVWNIGNTTVRNPQRLREALQLFAVKMEGRPFRKTEQREFQRHMIEVGFVDSERLDGDDGARKFASAFKQLGFVTDWSNSKEWSLTPVGRALLQHPRLEETIFLRQLLKYQLPSPLEGSRTYGFQVRPYRLLLQFLKRAHDEGMIGLTKFEIGLYVITVLTEDAAAFEAAFAQIKAFRATYDGISGNVRKRRYADEQFQAIAGTLKLKEGTLRDYADSNSRYALMSGLLTLRGNKLAIAESRLPFIETLLAVSPPFLIDDEYLRAFYDPELPTLPSDDVAFLARETTLLRDQLTQLSAITQAPIEVSPLPLRPTLTDLQAYEHDLRAMITGLREIQFYREQPAKLDEIAELLEDIRDGALVGGNVYAPAYFEWAIWRLFLAMNDIEGEIKDTRGFSIDEDMQPTHHARGGSADLVFKYADFCLVCEITLMGGSRQFAGEGEPVTRHVYKAIIEMSKPVYGLFVANKLDPNTADAFHQARYWSDWNTTIQTPIVALTTDQVLTLVNHMREQGLKVTDLRILFDRILGLQNDYADGPSWYKAYSELYLLWASGNVL